MNDKIYLAKKALRKEIKKLKKDIDAKQRHAKSINIMMQLENLSEFTEAKTIFIYWAMDDEVDTRDFIIKWYKKKDFILPSINKDRLVLKKFTGTNSLQNGDIYSIPEPIGEPFTTITEIDLAIIPGVAFDKNNNRMGRGKAYYDNILKQMENNTFLVGICYDIQFVNKVPTETHDIKMNKVVYS